MWPDETLLGYRKDFNISPESWEQTANDRAKWRSLIRMGANVYEAKRVCKAEQKCKERKARSTVSSSELSSCTICYSLESRFV